MFNSRTYLATCRGHFSLTWMHQSKDTKYYLLSLCLHILSFLGCFIGHAMTSFHNFGNYQDSMQNKWHAMRAKKSFNITRSSVDLANIIIITSELRLVDKVWPIKHHSGHRRWNLANLAPAGDPSRLSCELTRRRQNIAHNYINNVCVGWDLAKLRTRNRGKKWLIIWSETFSARPTSPRKQTIDIFTY